MAKVGRRLPNINLRSRLASEAIVLPLGSVLGKSTAARMQIGGTDGEESEVMGGIA